MMGKKGEKNQLVAVTSLPYSPPQDRGYSAVCVGELVADPYTKNEKALDEVRT